MHYRLQQTDNHKQGHVKLTKEFTDKNPLVYFIYHPWFETLPYSPHSHVIPTGHAKFGPFWFGNNSTRGVLSEAVAKAMTQAKYPATKPLELIWQRGITPGEAWDPANDWEWTDWKLDGYLRTAVSRVQWRKERPRNFSQDHLPAKGKEVGKYLTNTYQEPIIQWEFLHPELPILRITAENSTVLPLTVGNLERPKPTEYSVSFVISLQNRWASLDDPNRMLARFDNQTANLIKTPFAGTAPTGNQPTSRTSSQPHQTWAGGTSPTTCNTGSSAPWWSRLTNRKSWNPGYTR